MRPTIKLVASEAGVSTATVSYVLSGRTGSATGPGVSSGTIEKVHAAAQKLGYRPNQAARTIRTGKTNLMMLSLTMLSDPWSLSVSRAVSAAAQSKGITPMILADADWRTALANQNADVVFIDDAGRDGDAERLAEMAQRQKLVVFSETLEPNGFDVIRSVTGPTCEEAVDHLARSHSRIGCLTYPSTRVASRSVRYGAYVRGLERAGIEFRDEYVAEFAADPISAFEAAMTLLQRPDRPTAIYAITDYAAIAAVHAAQRLQLRVPEDVAVMGVGNTTEGELMTPSLSTVGPIDFFEGLADFLLSRAEGTAGAPQVLEFPWQLLVRDSAPGAVRG
ncbi:LacI family DNA-binding transcriptional regulator [Arthrobacter sp. 35W]|uniref:LacI family DNA-binding transcriptional regulator n=1 Tax=Arthrobacter sp. 35W TaxID=1132441 RepID=UPI00041203EF|nr:LacI family DNA-binding transcriptional regulator [Arthrobacter sp. 35W]